MQVADTGIKFFCAIPSKKKRFRVYQLSWIPVSSYSDDNEGAGMKGVLDKATCITVAHP
ncbi:hypothetical protein [Wolbachia endosymbiont of Encarsia formosa]|uniref:hypothetical protein n=1 Tax=Wolbachia endosymbiont of Encarsia formosa TaxID=77125 RepID=UPI0031BB5E01